MIRLMDHHNILGEPPHGDGSDAAVAKLGQRRQIGIARADGSLESGSGLVGVPRFKSWPPHSIPQKRGRLEASSPLYATRSSGRKEFQ